MTRANRRVPRLEDPRLLTGQGRFVDDVDRPSQLWMRVVRSTMAHADLIGVDAAQARRLPGVVAVWTGEDLGGSLSAGAAARIPVRLSPRRELLAPYLQPILATSRVRYVGEPVAAVVAEDPYVAEDAAELVEVAYSEREAVLGPVASGGASDCLFEGHENEVIELVASFGDAEAAFRSAPRIVTIEVRVARQTAVPMETRGLVAEWSAAGDLEIWGATKVPHFNRRVIAELLGVPVGRIRMRPMDAGGGFGVRGELYPEDVLVPALARALGRPVKWIEDRAEHLVSANHSRAQSHRISGAFDDEGRILGLTDEIWHDNGAYIRTHGLTVPELTVGMLPGPYRVPAYEGRVHVGLTNMTPCGTMRAPGRYEGTFARERLLDTAASELGLDPIELRRRNLLSPAELPLDRSLTALGTDVVLDAGDYAGLLDATLEAAGYDEWRDEAARLRGAGRLVGTGAVVFLEKSGLGPYETAAVSVKPDGRVAVATGGTSLGQGIETVLAQIAASQLSVPLEDVDVVAGDTGEIEDGVGSWASRSTVVGGSAVHLAAGATAALVREAAARLFETLPDNVRIEDGRVFVAGSSDVSVSFAELAAVVADPRDGSHVGGGRLWAERTYEVAHMTYPYGVHLAQVEVDEATGAVEVRRYFVGYEVGCAINPTNVEGQLVGGAVQGLGGALMEEIDYSNTGQPLSASLMDYALPFATEAPRVAVLVREDYPTVSNPLGAKGAGEGGLTACGAAVASAVGDALGRLDAPRSIPLTPRVVYDLLRERAAAG